LSVPSKVSLKRLTAFAGSRPPSCKNKSTLGNLGRRDLGAMIASWLGKPVAVRRVIPNPASTAAQTPCGLRLLKAICQRTPALLRALIAVSRKKQGGLQSASGNG